MTYLAIATLFLASAPAHGADEDPFAKIEITAEHVAGSVHMLTGAGGNIGASVGPDGVLIVDDQFLPLADRIQTALSALPNAPADPPVFVLNTHWHGDHTGGNPHFGKHSIIVAHDNVRQRLSVPHEKRGKVIEVPEVGWPVVTFGDSMSIHFNGEEIRLLHLPAGHTDGDMAVIFTGSKVVHTGDHFFKDRFPFVDLNSGGTVSGYANNVATLLELAPPDAQVIPGHGGLATLDDLRRFHGVITETKALVEAGQEAGKSLEKLQKQGLPEQYDSWGTGFIDTDRWIATIYGPASAD